MAAVSEQRSPILPCMGSALYPSLSVSTINMLCCLDRGASGLVKAKTSMNVPLVPLPIITLDPLRTHSLPSFTAVVATARVSEPASGSVMANPMTASPVKIGSSHFSPCSSVPKRINSSAPKVNEQSCWLIPGSTFQNSSITIACSR